jgi:O-antigen/teichoic acid export membrane protein
VATHAYHAPQLKSFMPLFALIMVGTAFAGFLGQALQGFKDVSRRTVITNFVGTPLMMILTLILVSRGLGLWGYIFAQVASSAAIIVLLGIAVYRLTPEGARHVTGPVLPLEAQVWAFSATAFGISLLEFLLAQVDKILIGVFINAREVGIYAVATTIVAFIPVALQSVNQIFSPTIADLHARGQRELLGRLYQTLTKWILGFTLPLAAVVIVFARPLMRIFGAEFEPGWIVLMIGTLGQLINCATGSVGYLLLMSGNQGRLMRVQTVMTVALIVMNLLLIPKLGILGAVLATAITNVVTNFWNLREVRATLGLSPYNKTYRDLLLPGFGAVGVALLMQAFGIPARLAWLYILVAIAVAYLVFAGVAILLGLGPDDRLILNAIYARFRGLTKNVAEM